MTTLTVERTQTDVPLQVVVNRNGGVTGLTAVVAIRDGDSVPATPSYLDFADNTFKTAGWTTRQAALGEVGDGRYSLSGGLDLTAITNLPAGTTHLFAEYEVSGTEAGVADDVLQLVNHILDVAEPGDEMDLVTDAVDANSVATSGAQEIRDEILSDSTPFAGANIDAAISSRAAPGDAMTLTAGAISSITTDVWSEALPGAFAAGQAGFIVGTNLNATVSSRATQADILSDATPFPGANIDATISSRAAPGDAMDLVASAVDSTSLDSTAVDDIADGVWDELIAGHLGVGSTGEALNTAAAGGGGLTQQQVRDAMKLAPTAGAPAAGSVDEHLDDILADTAAMQPLIDVATSTRAAPGDAMTLTAGALASVSTTVWTEAVPGAFPVGSAGLVLATRSAPGDAMALTANAVNATSLATSAAQEIRDEILTDATPFPGANIDATISSRATQADILSDATPFPGANIDTTISSRASALDLADLASITKLVEVTVVAGSSATEIRTSRTEADDFWNNATILVEMPSGVLVPRRVGAYRNTNGAFYPTEALPAVPSSGDRFIILAAVQSDLGDLS